MFTNSLLLVALRNDFDTIERNSFIYKDCQDIKKRLNGVVIPVSIQVIKLYEIYHLWGMFSAEQCAEWLIVNDDTVRSFYEHLKILDESIED